jgi:DeoR family fructose operon transcriptional repressor
MFSGKKPNVREAWSVVGAVLTFLSVVNLLPLILAGGLYHPQSNSFYGGITNDILNQVNANKAIIGVHGISCLAGLTTPMQHAAETTKLMINRTRGEVIVVADHRKLGLISDYVTAPTNRINTLITDWFPDTDYIHDFEDLGIKVIQTRPKD